MLEKKFVKTKCPLEKKYFQKLVGKNIPARKNFCSEKYFVQKIFARKKCKKKMCSEKNIFKIVLGKKILARKNNYMLGKIIICSEK